MSRSDELLVLANRWNDAWNSRQASELASFFGDGTYYEPALDGPVPGRTGIAAVAEKTWADWPGVAFEVVSVTVAEPRVVLEWRSSATHRSGKTVELEGVDVLTWKGEQIESAKVYYDVHTRNRALG